MAEAFDPAELTLETVALDPAEAVIVDHGRWCPADPPCPGRPAVGIVVPAYRQNQLAITGRVKVGEVGASYCPQCRTMRADAPREGAPS